MINEFRNYSEIIVYGDLSADIGSYLLVFDKDNLVTFFGNEIWAQVVCTCQFNDIESVAKALDKNFKINIVCGSAPIDKIRRPIGYLVEEFKEKLEIYVSQDLSGDQLHIYQVGNNMLIDFKDGKFLEIKDPKENASNIFASMISGSKKLNIEEMEKVLIKGEYNEKSRRK